MAQYSLHRPRAAASGIGALDQLRREMDALLSRFGGGAVPATAAAGWQGVFPAVNLYETADAYVLTAELPGVAPDDIQVSLEGSNVTLQGERRIELEESAMPHRRERQAGGFRRAFALPAAIEADKVEAIHRNGVLLLRLPKTAAHQPRRIAVQAS